MSSSIPVVAAPQVNSASGLIIGHRAPNRTNTFEFLGVKYGKAPIGNLRFVSPQRYVPPPGTIYNASTWNADCPASIPPVTTFPYFTGNGLAIYNQITAHNDNKQSENYLAPNIWTRSPSNVGSFDRPVFVFFHGGRFTIPGPHSPFYNGQFLTDTQTVVVVIVGYRLGMFGFSGAPGLEQKPGLRDQRSAVEWVRDNIVGFGGDPKRIIILGQSAGGASVDYWAYAYRNDPIVAGLISHSGTALSFLPTTPEYAQSLFYNVSGTLNCGSNTTSTASILTCLRSKNTTSMLLAARLVPTLPTQALAQAAFHPTVDNTLVFANYTSLGLAGHFAKLP